MVNRCQGCFTEVNENNCPDGSSVCNKCIEKANEYEKNKHQNKLVEIKKNIKDKIKQLEFEFINSEEHEKIKAFCLLSKEVETFIKMGKLIGKYELLKELKKELYGYE